jgi:ribulose-5-phosphate 4-epimerase/fuculose-1-phosphate aldolase
MMGNHGVTTVAATVAEAFDALYHLERAAKTLWLAYATGQALSVMPDDIAEQTAQAWEEMKPAEFAHFEEMKRLLDREDPSYRD